MRKSPVLLATAVIGAVGVLLSFVTAFIVEAPSVSPDEWGYLLNGQVLLGRHEVFIPFAKFYGPIYGVFSAAGAWLTGSLQGAYRFDLVANAALNLVLVALCVWIAARILGASREIALLTGVVVLVSPGGFDGALFAWAESLGRVLVVLVAILVWRAAQSPTTVRLVTVAGVAGCAPFVHGRFVSIVAAVLVLLAIWAVTRHAHIMSVGLAAVSLVVVYAGGRFFSAIMRGWLYRGSGAQELRLVRRLIEPSLWTDIVRETGGQLWYALAASLGLFLVGVVWMARRSVLPVRGSLRSCTTGEGALSMFMLSTAAIVVVLGSLQLARAERGDQFIYGRHVEAFLPIFLVVAVVEVSGSKCRVHRPWMTGALSILGISAVYTVAQRQDIVHQWVILNGPLKTANILAVDAMADLVGTEGLISLGVGFVLVALVVIAVHRRTGLWAFVFMAVLMLVSSVYTARTTMVERSSMHRAIGDTSELVGATRFVRVGYDGRVLHDKRYFALRYLLHPAQLEWLDVKDGVMVVPPGVKCVYGFADKPPAVGQWTIADREAGIDRVLWLREGQDRC